MHADSIQGPRGGHAVKPRPPASTLVYLILKLQIGIPVTLHGTLYTMCRHRNRKKLQQRNETFFTSSTRTRIGFERKWESGV